MHTHKNIIKKRWSRTEINFIEKNYRAIPVSNIAKQLQRSERSVRSKIERLGYRLSTLERNSQEWSRIEIKILEENSDKSIRQLSRLISTRTYSAIYSYARKTGRKKTYKGWHLDAYGRKIISLGKRGCYVAEHRLIVEQKIGRKLQGKECVHHIDFDKTNNKIENLHLFKSPKNHMEGHRSIEKLGRELLERGVIEFDNNSGKYKIKC